ncbi:MAG: HEAT repeat domain-containing protein [Gemmataceae bacterium]
MRPRSGRLILACLAMLSFDGKVIAKDPPIDVTSVRQVRKAVVLGCQSDANEIGAENTQYLLHIGEKAFPAYEAILADQKATPDEVSRVFYVLDEIEADRRCFLKHTVARLTDTHFATRLNAVILLGNIGSPAEASPVVALLSDKRVEVVSRAAWALADIGGPNEVVAMDVWLRGVSFRDSAGLRKFVQEHRNKLKKRLDEAKDPKKRAEKIQQCWRDLRIVEPEDEYKVHHAVRDLTAFGAEPVAFLKERVRPVDTATQKQLDQLLSDLDSDSFVRREAAKRELARGVVAEEVLEKALANHPSLELKKRLEAILEDMPEWRKNNPELLRQVRAVWVLQQIGTPEAKALLEKIAAGAPSARLTQKAKDALQFLDRLKKQ